MNEIELTQLFVDYANAKKRLEELSAQIASAVLEIGETRKVAGVSATYYKPSHETPDYEAAAKTGLYDGFDTSPFQTTTVSTSWKSVCEALGIKPPDGAEKPARVVVK
jgi:hypothetical protein